LSCALQFESIMIRQLYCCAHLSYLEMGWRQELKRLCSSGMTSLKQDGVLPGHSGKHPQQAMSYPASRQHALDDAEEESEGSRLPEVEKGGDDHLRRNVI